MSLAAGLGYGFDSYAVNIYSLVLPAIVVSLGISMTTSGLIGSIFLVGYTVGTIGFGILADKKGRKDALGLSILLYGLTTALGGLTKNVALFTGLRFLTGVGGAGELAVGAPYAVEMWKPRWRAVGTGGIIFSCYSVGYVVAATVALLVVPTVGWEWAFIVAVVPAVLVYFLLRRLSESSRYTVAKIEAEVRKKQGVEPPKLWQMPGVKKRILVGWLIYTANAVGYWGMTVFLTTVMIDRFGVSAAQAIVYALLFYVAQFFFCYIGSGLADAWGRRPSAILGAIVMMVAIVIGATTQSLTVYVIFGGASIATLGWLWSVGDTYVAELFPTEFRGTGFGLSVGGGRVLSIFAPVLVGWGITTYGPTGPYLAFVAVWALTIIGYLIGPETARRELDDIAPAG